MCLVEVEVVHKESRSYVNLGPMLVSRQDKTGHVQYVFDGDEKRTVLAHLLTTFFIYPWS